MKKAAFIVAFLVLISCSAERPAVRPSAPAVPRQELPQQQPLEPVSGEMPVSKTVFKCQEDTGKMFNSCGLDVLPFLRPFFYDIDNDGSQEMIVGNKDGRLALYRHDSGKPEWRVVDHYFAGIKAGAFSAPAAGDVNGDGKPEILVGTGGFSSDSGKVVIYRNAGTSDRPLWKRMETSGISVGNDATPALFETGNPGRPDLVVGNSEGRLFLFRNRSRDGRTDFEKDPSFFKGIRIGMYAAPAVTLWGDSPVIIAGNDMGKLFLFRRTKGRNGSWSREKLGISFTSFASPAFIANGSGKGKDLVVADGNGLLSYFRNSSGNYREWRKEPDYFDGRIVPGSACAPAVTALDRKYFMVVGNINGEIKLFEYTGVPGKLPWAERPGFFGKIKLHGFSRGVLAQWRGRQLLITGQQDGMLRAFLNDGTGERPQWNEQKGFFRGIPKIMHAAPAVFDIDGDGRWEMIVGDADGRVRGFRYDTDSEGKSAWKEISGVFDRVRVDRFASPSVFRDSDRLYLLAGQQDGRITLFTADASGPGRMAFLRDDYLAGIRMNGYSAPSAIARAGLIELSVGDYSGVLKHFACKKTALEIKGN